MGKSFGQRWKAIPLWAKWLSGILVILCLLVLLRIPILRGLGNALVYENDLRKTQVLFVLSGSPYDRGTEAARLLREGWAERVVCTGELIPHDFKALGLSYRESDLIRSRLLQLNVADSLIEVIHQGTSTKEEADVVLNYCKSNHLTSVTVVSSKFHTRRIKQVFKRKFRKAGIELCIRGAPSSSYHESAWWKSEGGLLAVNNEYVKMIWYLLN
jgi:uncharacterized SAM-binding protein YcdF (DUF218 family)